MSSRCRRVLAPGLALALVLGACHASRLPSAPASQGSKVTPPAPGETAPGAEGAESALADQAGAGSGSRLAAEIDPEEISAAVAELRFAVSERATLVAVAGERSAPLPVEKVSKLGQVRWSSERSEVDVQYEDYCGRTRHAKFSARTLMAHLENTEARAAYRAGRAAEAAAGFARAVALDPALDLALDLDLDLAQMDPALALAAAGDVNLAMAVLEPLRSRNPVHLYARVMLDPELAALREHPAITSLRSPTPGTASATRSMMWSMLVGVDPKHGYIAAVSGNTRWDAGRYDSLLQIFDAATGEVLTELPFVTRAGSACGGPLGGQCEVLPGEATRVEAVNGVLRDLGFVREFKAIQGTDYQVVGSGITSMSLAFPADRLSLVIGLDLASVVRTEGAPARGPKSGPGRAPVQLLVQRAVPEPWQLVWAQYLPEVDVVAYAWQDALRCSSGSPAIVVLPLSSGRQEVHGP